MFVCSGEAGYHQRRRSLRRLHLRHDDEGRALLQANVFNTRQIQTYFIIIIVLYKYLHGNQQGHIINLTPDPMQPILKNI